MHSIKDYDYQLPKELIAQYPIKVRDHSKLLIYNKKTKEMTHHQFTEIINYLTEGDVIVINETKVINTKLIGKKSTGGQASITIIKPVTNTQYEAFVKCKSPKPGTQLIFSNDLSCEIISKSDDHFIINFSSQPDKELNDNGDYTLPGYIHNQAYDRDRYQTVFADKKGSVAAPTAGLHFTPELIKQLENKGIKFAKVCLHVGLGTFAEIRDNDYTKHKMHTEQFEITPDTANIINNRKGKLIVVGTTSLRSLESACNDEGQVIPIKTDTGIFIYPGYKFKLKFNGIITNFHLPKTSLLLLISTIIGNAWKTIYNEAIKEKYRFYSFGDAMLIID